MKANLRWATAEDARALKDLDTVVPCDSGRTEWIDRWLREDSVMVAEQEGRVIGYAVFNHAFFRKAQVEMLMIHPEFRGQRVGDALLAAIEAGCDAPRLYVTTNQSNIVMQRLLQRRGFRTGGSIHELDPGDPELVFVKDLGKSAASPGDDFPS